MPIRSASDHASTTTEYSKRRRAFAIGALALGAFGIGLTEFVVVGLLGPLGEDLDVSIPTAGLLVTGYAAAVAIGAPIMTAAGIGVTLGIAALSVAMVSGAVERRAAR